MRVTVFAMAAMSSVVALVGFAGAAQASATVDLLWIDVTNVDTNGNPICLRPAQRNCPQLGTTLSSVAVTDSITLGVLITAGAKGLLGGSVSVNFTDALPKLSVTGFQRMSTTEPFQYLPAGIGPIVPEDLQLGDDEEMLMTVSAHRRDLEAYRNEGDDAGEERSELVLTYDYVRIRSHCAEYGLELPHDVPPEDAA